jgi:hypothetical protein
MQETHSPDECDAYAALLDRIALEDRSSDTLDFQHGVRFPQSNNSDPAGDHLVDVSPRTVDFLRECFEASRVKVKAAGR